VDYRFPGDDNVAEASREEVIRLKYMRYSHGDERVDALMDGLAAHIRSLLDVQADLKAWSPDLDHPILIEFKRHRTPWARLPSARDCGQPELLADYGDRYAARVLNAALYVVGERLRTGPLTGEPSWLPWARDRFESLLRRPSPQATADASPARVRVIRREGAAFLGAIAAGHLRSLRVTFGTRQLARDYRTARLRLASGILTALGFMLARLVSACARRPKVPDFLLVMLATARHYGHRSEPDHHALLASVWKLGQCKGAACPVT
jgi:hypothetical protein